MTTLTDNEAQVILGIVPSLKERVDQLWGDRTKGIERRKYVLSLAVTTVCPIIGGVVIAVILKTLHL
jgi:hypothetical protein